MLWEKMVSIDLLNAGCHKSSICKNAVSMFNKWGILVFYILVLVANKWQNIRFSNSSNYTPKMVNITVDKCTSIDNMFLQHLRMKKKNLLKMDEDICHMLLTKA